MLRRGNIRIGISGWRYPPWRGIFYPKGLTQAKELAYASAAFPSIELNGSFYSLQTPQSYQRWYQDTPDDFVFSIKGGRYITHLRRLVEIEAPLANFFASGIFHLKEKTGPFLWQFPPHFRYDEAKFESFFSLLPFDLESAARLARRRDDRMTGRSALKVDTNRKLRHAVEIRHESFRTEKFVSQLRRYGISLVFADTAGKWPYFEDLTADFVYLRLHGDAELYVSGYSPEALDRWANRIHQWASGKQPEDAVLVTSRSAVQSLRRDVYCYFDNDVKVRAPVDAMDLTRRLGLKVPPAIAAGMKGEALDPALLAQLPFEAAPLGTRWQFKKAPSRRRGAKTKT